MADPEAPRDRPRPARFALMTVTVTVESFHIDGTRTGVLVRKVSPGRLETLTCFDLPDGGDIVSLHHAFEYDHDPFGWSGFSYRDDSSRTVQVGERADGGVVVNGRAVPTKTDRVIPSYASWLLLQDLVVRDLTEVEYEQINEGGPEPTVVAATLRHDRAQGTVVLLEDDVPGNTFWVADGQVTRSDWCGAESYPVANPHDALEGLSERVATTVRVFLL